MTDRLEQMKDTGMAADLDLVATVIFQEWGQHTREERHRSRWIMSPDMLEWIKDLFPPPPDPPPWSPSAALTEWACLCGRPIETREGAEGIRLEPLPDPEDAFEDRPEPIPLPDAADLEQA